MILASLAWPRGALGSDIPPTTPLLRARQAAETRKTVLGAATRLFTERGWAGTTLAAVAAEAGTAVETGLSGFRIEVGLLIAAIDVAIVGDDAEEPLVERPESLGLAWGNALTDSRWPQG